MKHLFILFTLFFPAIASAQTLTREQAIGYAEKLHKAEILSKKGKKQLVASISGRDSMLTSEILRFCAGAFYDELVYRSGYSEYMRLRQKAQQKWEQQHGQAQEPDSAFMAAFQEKFDRHMENFEGLTLEGNIAAEDAEVEKGISQDVSSTGEPGLIHPNRSVMGKTRTRILNELLKLGLISERIYREVLVQREELGFECYVVNYAAERTEYCEQYPPNKAKQVALLNQLKAAQVISQEKAQQLLASYKEFELKEQFDFLPYCNSALIFDYSTFPAEPERYYAMIFSELKKIVPGFDYTNFSVLRRERISPHTDQYTYIDLVLSLESEGRKYSYSFEYGGRNKEPYPSDTLPGKIDVDNGFHRMVNKWLADHNAPQRLYGASKAVGSLIFDPDLFGLILMTEAQAEAWRQDAEEFSFYRESHDNRFNSENIEKLIEDYERIGLFSHLTDAEKAEGRQKVNEDYLTEYLELLSCFPKIVVNRGTYTWNVYNPYKELAQAYSRISRGAFTPTDIHDTYEQNWKNATTYCQFTFRKKTYSTELAMMGSSPDPVFIDLINKALEENSIDGRFYHCPGDRWSSGHIFLTEAQHEYLKKHQPELFSGKTG